jgi:DNA (cytosine-5)-methyltransferase 1
VLGAKDAGAPHKRDRIWVLAHAQSIRHGQGREIRDLRKADGRPGCPLFPRTCGPGSDVAHTNREGLEEWGGGSEKAWSCAAPVVGDWWAVEPPVGRLVDGFPGRVDQLKALGNAQVPAVAALAWETLMARVIGH